MAKKKKAAASSIGTTKSTAFEIGQKTIAIGIAGIALVALSYFFLLTPLQQSSTAATKKVVTNTQQLQTTSQLIQQAEASKSTTNNPLTLLYQDAKILDTLLPASINSTATGTTLYNTATAAGLTVTSFQSGAATTPGATSSATPAPAASGSQPSQPYSFALKGTLPELITWLSGIYANPQLYTTSNLSLASATSTPGVYTLTGQVNAWSAAGQPPLPASAGN